MMVALLELQYSLFAILEPQDCRHSSLGSRSLSKTILFLFLEELFGVHLWHSFGVIVEILKKEVFFEQICVDAD